jgi:hypothetical protein
MVAFMCHDTISNAIDKYIVSLIGCLAALAVASEAGAGTFPPTSLAFASGGSPQSAAAGNLDANIEPNLVSVSAASDDVGVLPRNGNGGFAAPVFFQAGNWPEFAAGAGSFSVAVADFDSDTIPDLATANARSDDVSFLRGVGDGTFQDANSFPAGDFPQTLAVADLDGDRTPDLVTANTDSDDVSVLLGNGDGTFQAAASFAVGDAPISVAVADLDGDTIVDLVTANAVTNDVSVLVGNGDGTFAAGAGSFSVAVADFDSDTIPDLATANARSDDVSFLRGNGDGTFQTAVHYAAGVSPQFVAAADLDGNTSFDVVTANVFSHDLSVLLGNGDGTFQAAVPYAAGESPLSVASADLDGDTDLDLITANGFIDHVAVLLNLLDPIAALEIDIKPGNDLNPINPMNRGVTPVAILGSETFDVADVDVTTLAFGPNGAGLAHQNGPHVKDGNNDGLDDLLAHFLTADSGIAFGDEEACVTGELLDGTPFEGCDTIATEPPCGRGYEAALLLPPLLWARRRLRSRAV